MDPVTHALTGASVAGGAAKGEHVRRAMLAGGLAALLPDLDVLLQKDSDPLFQLELHRQFSHAFTTFPLVAALLAITLHRVSRRKFPLGAAFSASLLGLVSAGFLDACTSYGTQLLWPWSSERFAFNIVPVVDPLFTLLLGALLVAAFRASNKLWRYLPVLCLGLYLVHGAIQQARAHQAIRETAAARKEHPTEIVLKPTLGNQTLWRAVYQHENNLQTAAVRTGLQVTVTMGERRPLWEASQLELPPNTRLSHDLERFAVLSDRYLVAHPDQPEVIGDARYAMLPTSLSPLWGLKVDLSDPERAPEFVTFRVNNAQVRQEFWRLYRGR